MTSTPIVDISAVRWQYAGATEPALEQFSLQIPTGQVLAICGASGSGKSTVLRLINGLIPHFHDGKLQGEVQVAGIDVPSSELDEIGQKTGTVLQHPRRQFFTETVTEEIAFACENFGFPQERIKEHLATIKTEYSLADLPTQSLQFLSGGQQQHVAAAAANTHQPPILLLDEPTSNLSTRAITEFAHTLQRIKASGQTIVLTEHRLHFLHGIVDRVIVMKDGAIHADWTASEFAQVSDSDLEAEGLRSRAPANVHLSHIAASGPSVLDPQANHAYCSTTYTPAAAAQTSDTGTDTTVATTQDSAIPSAEPETNSNPAKHSDLIVRDLIWAPQKQAVLDIKYAHFPAGQVTAVRGDNGVGKTSLARILVGLSRHKGQILSAETKQRRRTRQQHSSMVMQDVQRQLFTESVAAEIALARIDSHAENTESILQELQLDDLLERHPLALSGGQQQRLVVATARLSGGKVVIFDEPSSGVDRRHLESITHQIRRVADSGAVVLLISHDDDLLARVADQQIVLTAITTRKPQRTRLFAGL